MKKKKRTGILLVDIQGSIEKGFIDLVEMRGNEDKKPILHWVKDREYEIPADYDNKNNYFEIKESKDE